MTSNLFTKAKFLAVENGRTYHVAAVLRRKGKIVKIGENTDKTHPRFKRQYEDGTWASHMHAEMNVLRFAKPGDTIDVMRFRKCDHSVTMANPCHLCMSEMKKSGIKRVRYTNWLGEWEEIEIET